MRYSLAYGRSGLELDLPDSWDITVLRRKPMPVIADPRSGIETALDHPIGCRKLTDEAAGRRTACILICDITRPVPHGLILRPVIEELLSAGLQPEGITVLVATGLHRPNEGRELETLIGDPWVTAHARAENHFARRDEDHVLLGTTSRGIPVRLDRRFVSADLKVVVGLVEPHFMAGWSGGRKLLVPGIAHAETITAFHSAQMLENDHAAAGILSGNPLHDTQSEAVRMAGRVLAVSVVTDAERALAYASFGEVQVGLAAAVTFAERYAVVPVERRFPVVVSTGAGWPLDATYYKTVKGICTGASILEEGGTLLVASECAEGFGSNDFRHAQERMIQEGPRQFRAGAAERAHADIDEWQTLMLARSLQVGPVHLLAGGLAPQDQLLTGAVPEGDLRAALGAAVSRSRGGRLAVIPEGPYVLPRIAAEREEAP